MPKMKTKRGAAKRLKKTASGQAQARGRLEAAQAGEEAAGAPSTAAPGQADAKADVPRMKRLVPYL